MEAMGFHTQLIASCPGLAERTKLDQIETRDRTTDLSKDQREEGPTGLNEGPWSLVHPFGYAYTHRCHSFNRSQSLNRLLSNLQTDNRTLLVQT